MGQPSIIYCAYGVETTATISLTGNGVTTQVLFATEDQYYSPLSTDAFSIVIDLGAAQAVSSFALIGANMDGTLVEVRASLDNFGASDVAIDASTALTSSVNSAWRGFNSDTFRYWKLLFTGNPSNLRVAHVCLMDKPILPYFETDPDITNSTPTVKQLISPSGIYNGSNQHKSMRKFTINWGQVTPSELVNVQAWATACIETVRSFTFIPDIDEVESFYCWIPSGGEFKAPYLKGVHTVSNMTFETRAK